MIDFYLDMRYARSSLFEALTHDDISRGNLVLPRSRAEVSAEPGKLVNSILNLKKGPF
uniref:Uncharacterized protein n=1 Tax=Thermosporothrix sp. COM3 TaxID=2490863 RepID=A0A455SDF5_9CHLR|nr:hypothetical protein KTC_01290 [Thermosporothrix sp. COM3]